MNSRTPIHEALSHAVKLHARRTTLLRWLSAAKALRTFALGSISILLVVFLLARGFSEIAIGGIFSASLVEDAIVTTLVASYAARIGMRPVLMAFSLIVVSCALIMGFCHLAWAVAAAAIFGIISPAGYEGGPFGAIEQTIVSKLVPSDSLAKALSRYHLAGFAGAAVGALLTGGVLAWFNAIHFAFSYEVIFSAYALAGAVLLVIYSRLDLSVCSELQNDTAEAGSLETEPVDPLRKSNGQTKAPKVVFKLCALQGLDAFGGGLVTQAIVAYWFYARYHAGPEFLGPLFFWGNVIAAASFVIAPVFVKRFGCLNTMVFTHLPCSLGLCLIPLMPTASLAGLVILLRCIFSSMDIPARQAFTMLLVKDKERPVALAMIDSSRSLSQAIAPAITGSLMSNPATGVPFILAGICKSAYDICLYLNFRKVPMSSAITVLPTQAQEPIEERQPAAVK